MIRLDEHQMRSLAKLRGDTDTYILATRHDNKWCADLVIPDYQRYRMKSQRLRARMFGNIESLIKACEGISSEIRINPGVS